MPFTGWLIQNSNLALERLHEILLKKFNYLPDGVLFRNPYITLLYYTLMNVTCNRVQPRNL